MALPIINFENALARAESGKRHLLMGNGFSIACKLDIFSYASLLEQADFSSSPEIPKIFKIMKTNDFEAVIKLLSNASAVVALFGGDRATAAKLAGAAETLKDILVQAIAKHHPDRPYAIENERYGACRIFLSNFSTYYTLNYDVLLYWALMNEDIDELDISRDDGFRSPEEETAEYVSWQEFQSANVYHLHGALHLFDEGEELRKYTWSRTEIPILDQIRRALDEEKFPLFVAEGTSREKMEKIMHSAYLHKGYRSLSSIGGNLYIFGHSLADSDRHIMTAIRRSKVKNVFVSIYGAPDAPLNMAIMAKAVSLFGSGKFPKTVHFFDAGSAAPWG